MTINGSAVLNATLAEVEQLLDQLPATLELGQPVLQEPLYLREAVQRVGERLGAWRSQISMVYV